MTIGLSQLLYARRMSCSVTPQLTSTMSGLRLPCSVAAEDDSEDDDDSDEEAEGGPVGGCCLFFFFLFRFEICLESELYFH